MRNGFRVGPLRGQFSFDVRPIARITGAFELNKQTKKFGFRNGESPKLRELIRMVGSQVQIGVNHARKIRALTAQRVRCPRQLAALAAKLSLEKFFLRLKAVNPGFHFVSINVTNWFKVYNIYLDSLH